jgi:hypothetical protein
MKNQTSNVIYFDNSLMNNSWIAFSKFGTSKKMRSYMAITGEKGLESFFESKLHHL